MASWREKLAAKKGMTLKQYIKTSDYKKKKKERDKKEDREKENKRSNNDYQDLIKSILKSTPAQNKVLPDFETTYSPNLEAEDYKQSEELYTPYFEKQIANDLEDLNAWSETENVSYNRSLRRARFSLASQGGAIGSERTKQEGDITQNHEQRTQNTIRGTERAVGTTNIQNAGYQSAGQNQEGSLVGKMKESIQSGQLWYKNQRAQRYYGNAKTYYSQPSAYSLSGDKL